MLIESLLSHAAQRPTEVAVIDDKGLHTYRDLAAMSAALGTHIAQQSKAPSVGLLLPAGAGFVASFYGTLLAGKSAVLINYLLGQKEIAHIVADSGIDTVLSVLPLISLLPSGGPKIIDISQLPAPSSSTEMKIPQPPATSPDAVAVLIYTSGTSGLPKGVELTFNNLQSCIEAAIAHAALKEGHRFLGVVPPFHSLGLAATVLAPMQLGAPVTCLSRFSAVAVMKTIREQGITLLFMVPSMYGALLHLKNAAADDFKNIYAAISGGEPLPEAIRENFRQRFGIPLLEGYGLTETCGVICFNVPHSYRPGSVGRFIPGAGARIVDDNDQPAAAGQSGEVWLHGPTIMKGYHNLPAETAAALTSDGYFKTGDLGRLDADGFLYITGRKKELIIVAGEKASPREIEDILMRHPAVADVAVLGKKDSARGEIVVAFVIARQGTVDTSDTSPPLRGGLSGNQQPALVADTLKNFCREQGLVQWKIPREIIVVTELPRSPTGKVLKRVLAEQLEKKSA